MSQNQVVEKITHLNAQLQQLKFSELSIQSTRALSKFYKRRIERYQEIIFPDRSVFNQPISNF